MEKLLDRSAIKPEDKWDVESIYKNIEEWEKDAIKCKELIDTLASKKETFLNSSKDFKEFMLLDSELARLLDKVYLYTSLKSNEDMANATYQELNGKAALIYQDYQEKTSFVVPMMLKENPAKIETYLNEEEELLPFRHNVMDILRYKKHHLTEEQDKVLAAFSKTLSAGSDTASFLMDADMRFGDITLANGEKIELTDSNYGIYLRDKDRETRRQAFIRMHEVYGSFKNTLNATLASVVNESSTHARLTNFKSSLEASLYANDIPTALYDNLINVVHKHLPLLYKYYDVKKEILGLEDFHLYDGYVNCVKKVSKKYSFEEGKELVLDALKVLGDEYINVLKTAFTDGWIDKYPNRGKTSGAYSSGCYDTKPFVLLNYTNNYDDVSTLAHELGHSMHSYFSIHYNDYENHSYPLFLAEIASTVNELLLSYYMENKVETKEEKLTILNERLDLFKATVFRQTMFAEFEKYIHNKADNNEILTADNLAEYYYQLNKKYFGDKVLVDNVVRYEWLRIPHFYRPFYVYQYATGLSIASYIAKNILEGKEGFRDKYILFLKSGGRDYPLEVLKIIDVDLKDTKVFEDAMSMFKETLERFSELSKN